ncbi:MAG TPA: hypothetical protein VLG92_04330 [Candidatus Saccharimonadia bacterium]|nr:hypothetical protein [Candidatus Saccharimonadia bacterium]
MKQKQEPFMIHFVCRGNTYRSRVAAAYTATLIDDRFRVSSSGIETYNSSIRTSELYAQAIAHAHNLTFGMDDPKTQTTDDLLSGADVIVFLNQDVYSDALTRYSFDTSKALAWDIADIELSVRTEILASKSEPAQVQATAATFQQIKEHCDTLYAQLT